MGGTGQMYFFSKTFFYSFTFIFISIFWEKNQSHDRNIMPIGPDRSAELDLKTSSQVFGGQSRFRSVTASRESHLRL